MRDPEYLINILEEAKNRSDGRILCPRELGASNDTLNRHHHVEQLVDASHADWVNTDHSIARITTQGYDFLNATEKQPDAKNRFLDLFNKGVPYVEAVVRVMDFVKGQN